MTSDPKATRYMAMLLQDPSVRDADGELLHEDWPFLLDRDHLLGTTSGKFAVRDADAMDLPLFDSPDWADSAVELTYGHFNREPMERPIVENAQFHQVNAFAVAGHTLRSFEEALGREIVWRSGGPLVIRPHAFEGANAFYDPMSPSLNFGFFRSPIRAATVWTCLSHDIVAHELGHAILDSFRPLWLWSEELDVPALHESIGDLLALFAALEHPQLVERIYQESGGDMRRPTLVSGLAEEFGIGLRGSGVAYLRSALEGPPYPEAEKEAHARSTAWTAAVYDVLVALVDASVSTDPPFEEFKQAVVTVTRRLRRMLLRALSYASPTGITMPMLARVLYEADQRLFPDDPLSRDLAKQVFEARGLWDDTLLTTAPGIGLNFQDWDSLGPAARAALVASHADSLRIPTGAGVRLLDPQLTTAVRQADAERTGVATEAVTERYLHYAYEVIATAMVEGPAGPEPLGISLFFGGTLVMDENWNDVLLVTDPPVTAEEAGAEDPALAAFRAAVERFRTTHRATLQSLRVGTVRSAEHDGARVVVDRPGCPFVVKAVGDGAVRFVRRRCDFADHLRSVSTSSAGGAQVSGSGVRLNL